MPVQRKQRTPEDIAAAEARKREEQVIHHSQVMALDKLYFGDKACQEFILALRENCDHGPGTTVGIDEIASATGTSYENTCRLLEQLESTGIGHLVRNRPMVDEKKPFTRFHWKASFHELIDKFIAMRER